jgi:hypothetical protein
MLCWTLGGVGHVPCQTGVLLLVSYMDRQVRPFTLSPRRIERVRQLRSASLFRPGGTCPPDLRKVFIDSLPPWIRAFPQSDNLSLLCVSFSSIVWWSDLRVPRQGPAQHPHLTTHRGTPLSLPSTHRQSTTHTHRHWGSSLASLHLPQLWVPCLCRPTFPPALPLTAPSPYVS